ncbi:MAG: alpha/beta hydrolase [Clostridia bacterium]|nr:alpha/beta hydrolase [Clostridia bacterium]
MKTGIILLIVLAAFALMTLIAFVSLMEYIFRTTFCRVQPKAVAYVEPPREKMNSIDRQRYDARKTLEAMPSARWEMTAEDGTVLVAHYVPTENAVRTVILFHGWRSTWARDFGMHTQMLQNAGCELLFVEQRAHGESGGKYIGFGGLEHRDCLQWIRFFTEKRKKALPIYLFGVSLGAATVLMASGKLEKGSVRGIIADSGFTSPADIVEKVMEQKKAVAPHFFTHLLNLWTTTRAGFSMTKNSTIRAMKTNTTPILFVHGKKDDFVPIEMTMESYAACNAEKRLLLVDGSPHAKAFIVAPETYEKTIKEFFGEHDA